jgi:AraC-like DNA-binding protein
MCLDFTERMQEIRKEAVISLHIRKCIDYIYENLGADLSVKTLAKAAELNPAYLSRLFRQETGIPLKRFVKEARVDTAQNLLRYSNLSYLVISTSLGFSTQSVFIAVFKEITGMTPKVYREKYYTKNR